MKIVKGNLITMAENGDFDVIVHGCNCFCTMGAGVAKEIRKHFPAAYEADCLTQAGDKGKLGEISQADCLTDSGELVTVVNAYTQFRYGRGLNLDYDALRKAMEEVVKKFSGMRIGMPKIGCGLAGGDWGKVQSILDEVFAGENVTVVEL